ncbi:hypothetical protein B0A48_07419 [Cryoendolithus antarcticus]|uniref:Uncharacterized protein n=1 Tax=Cryoendolithus antarcticus TaxID=1507870 RepID=A0A1V8T957_9PEZI|nr:hypothetical protein B0A48_07419 [Cryoendolithus antarcticus]
MRMFSEQSSSSHNLPEATTYKLLIDCLRMRQEDTYSFAGDTMVGTIYNSEPSSIPAFRKFIAKAEKAQILPPWWKASSTTHCLHLSASDEGFSLECAQEKSDIQETWKDHYMPMKLRMLAKVVYGNVPFPEARDVLGSMVQAEAGQGRLLGGF